ncbi:MAG TPA: Fe-S cluster assembly ATPase SufC [Candidatus Magasanikbacteria bacterium]|nr:MAG: Fe-S cluster assembly ATPase SufC [Candidatus Magasanikbacteria bacterium RIFCSPLOWO2_02_FULL_47_16]OGH79788.1 MAG: Fe-S cluster assembly ATPase SufC [Candidatus Magasanikbacteria bacterium RIFCSPHIGHO2_02_FULL_48_18]OGH82575.1 MAG: Fe-S cluster assembly ATPase SufC [Candidatus Magasanikbacteria bacterium RIFCSPLOWO2_12_FULL_47_9b]HAZ29119.1 Fe-S cluster assembly ATPase SufC [Candidatus Magasanikbacteria bacterium]
MNALHVDNLHVEADGKEIIHGLSLTVCPGEIHGIMGPNGSGKSTLVNALLGHPSFVITKGSVVVDGVDVTRMSPEKRARHGLFLSLQHVPEIPGVTVANFLRAALAAQTGKEIRPIEFYKALEEKMKIFSIDPSFASRYLNVGFSGGEKKKIEILQMSLLLPRYAILDEIDSGLDVDALKVVSRGINQFHTKKNAVLLITHYNRILEYVTPDKIHVMSHGIIAETGDKTLAEHIEEKGYTAYV